MGLVLVVPVDAQDIGRLSGSYLSPTQLRDPSTGLEAAELTTYRVEASLRAPIPVTPSTHLVVGAKYGWLGTRVSGVPGAPEPDFHEVGLSLGVAVALSDRWRITAHLEPSLASDFDDVDADAINVRGLVEANLRTSPRVLFTFGARAAYEFGRFLPLPVLGVEWNSGRGTVLDIRFPQWLRLWHTFRERVEFGVDVRFRGTRYQAGNRAIESVEETTLDAGPRVSARVSPFLWFELYTGVTLFRNFEIFASSSGEGLFDATLEPSFLVECSLVIRLPEAESALE